MRELKGEVSNHVMSMYSVKYVSSIPRLGRAAISKLMRGE